MPIVFSRQLFWLVSSCFCQSAGPTGSILDRIDCIIYHKKFLVLTGSSVCRLCKEGPNEEVFGKFFTAKEDGFSVHQYCLVRKRNFLITTLFLRKRANMLITYRGCALTEPGGPWRLTFALR